MGAENNQFTTTGVVINVLEKDIIFPECLGYHSQQRKPWDFVPVEIVKLGTFSMTSRTSHLFQSFFFICRTLRMFRIVF